MKYIHTKQQEEYDCGIACVASILKYYHLHYGINYLRDQTTIEFLFFFLKF
ncbi:cysteine peptidase family C39 domain-containing protein [Bacillus cereus]|uniref:cysteine peptidase family C39 domain-containing protein n=1 Tax=Bacillus cereus TaxID=1396 RepID=UPI0021AE23AD|nr:cysteine peptidase family C39 domain-containing protein [Bacillus cereus]